jgi:hypothetical protein
MAPNGARDSAGEWPDCGNKVLALDRLVVNSGPAGCIGLVISERRIWRWCVHIPVRAQDEATDRIGRGCARKGAN